MTSIIRLEGVLCMYWIEPPIKTYDFKTYDLKLMISRVSIIVRTSSMKEVINPKTSLFCLVHICAEKRSRQLFIQDKIHVLCE